MTTPRFLQIHTLTSYPGTLLNRDDAGYAKRLPFGGASRLRISSQSLKRHWRRAGEDMHHAHGLDTLGRDGSLRSRAIFTLKIARPLVEDGHDPAVIVAILSAFQESIFGKSAAARAADQQPDDDADDSAATDAGKAKKTRGKGRGKASSDGADGAVSLTDLTRKEVNVLGWPEVRYLREEAARLSREAGTDAAKAVDLVRTYLTKERKTNLLALAGDRFNPSTAGLDAALFGRMVSGDPLARVDAAIHVAHAFSIHKEETETDYFTAVDDLTRDEHAGSGHINETELTSGLFYGYVVVDLPLLVSNLEGVPQADWIKADRTLSGRVVDHLIHLITTTSPGAKKGSTAPYARAEFVLLEAGTAQPRTLANAFRTPVKPTVTDAIDALTRYLGDLDGMYGPADDSDARWYASVRNDSPLAAERLTVRELAARAAAAVVGG